MFHHISNTGKRVENTTRSGVFLSNFEVFDIVMKHCDGCFIQLLKQTDFEGEIKDAKTRSFSSDMQTRHGAWFPLSLTFELLMRKLIHKFFCQYFGITFHWSLDLTRSHESNIFVWIFCFFSINYFFIRVSLSV